MKRFLKMLFLLALVLLVVSFIYKNNYPNTEFINPQLFKEPVQTETDQQEIKITTEDYIYTVNPEYNYELYGLVVSYHHSDSFADYYHQKWGDSLNVKDICVFWGDNLKNNLHQKFKVNNSVWTCYYKTNDYTAWQSFNESQVSNNHLLVRDQKLRDKIKKAKHGDQIYIKGYLASYSHNDGFNRGTSTTRDDRGEGACETIYITDFKVLKQANLIWRMLFQLSIIILICCPIIWIFLPLKYHV